MWAGVWCCHGTGPCWQTQTPGGQTATGPWWMPVAVMVVELLQHLVFHVTKFMQRWPLGVCISVVKQRWKQLFPQADGQPMSLTSAELLTDNPVTNAWDNHGLWWLLLSTLQIPGKGDEGESVYGPTIKGMSPQLSDCANCEFPQKSSWWSDLIHITTWELLFISLKQKGLFFSQNYNLLVLARLLQWSLFDLWPCLCPLMFPSPLSLPKWQLMVTHCLLQTSNTFVGRTLEMQK